MYPYIKSRYKVEIDGMEAGRFSEMTGFDAPIDVEHGNDGAAMLSVKILGYMTKCGSVVLKQGIIDSKALRDWLAPSLDGEAVRKTINIVLSDDAGHTVASWQLISARITKYTESDFEADPSDVPIDTLEIAHEGIIRAL